MTQKAKIMDKEKFAIISMGVLVILALGFVVVSNASKNREVSKRADLESKLDRLAMENGKLQKQMKLVRNQLEEESRLNQSLSESLAKEQESAQFLRQELDRLSNTRRGLEAQLDELQNKNQTLERQIEAKATIISAEPIAGENSATVMGN